MRFEVTYVTNLALTVTVDAPDEDEATATAGIRGAAYLTRLAEDTSQGPVQVAATIDGIEPESVTTVDDEDQP